MKPYRYRTAEESRKPGYLARRFKAYRRLQRLKDEQAKNVTPLKRAAK